MKRRLPLKPLSIAGVVIAAALLIWQRSRGDVLEVESAAAALTRMDVTVDEDGRTRAIDRYVVVAPVAGRLERIMPREGEPVPRGVVLATLHVLPLDPSTRSVLQARLTAARAQSDAAIAALTDATAARQQAARELDRRRALEAAGAISRELVEQYTRALQSAEQTLRAAEEAATAAHAEVRAAEAALLGVQPDGEATSIQVRAPSDGVVLRVPERSERIVAAGEPLIELGDVTALEAVIDVLTADAVRIEPGMQAWITGWGGPPIAAVVERLEPAAFTRISALGVEEQRVNVILQFSDCPGELREGYRVEASIRVWSQDSVLVVPSSALFQQHGEWQAFVIERGRAVLRTVEPGERAGATTQMVVGLAPGETVILFPSDRLRAGMRVRSTTHSR